MREILFKAKRIDNGEWIIGNLYRFDRDPKSWQIQTVNGYVCHSNIVDPETVCQYIGLKDKNGIEIYEDDIVRGEKGIIAVVKWEEDIDCDRYWMTAAGFLIDLDDHEYGVDDAKTDKIEVIGNIYDNPELLK